MLVGHGAWVAYMNDDGVARSAHGGAAEGFGREGAEGRGAGEFFWDRGEVSGWDVEKLGGCRVARGRGLWEG